jgi:ribosomal protein S18 acetylase RimI-like enzyme
MTVSVHRLELHQKERASQVIAQAFRADPLLPYITTEKSKQDYFLSWLGHTGLSLGLGYGEVYTTPQVEGVAIWFWLSPGQQPMTLGKMLRVGVLPPFKLGLKALARFQGVADSTSKVHREGLSQAHWYLFLLAVDPSCQGQGLGGRLLQPVLTRADNQRQPCYLETTNPRTIPFYERHGFMVVRSIEAIRGGPGLWCLQRHPQSDRG